MSFKPCVLFLPSALEIVLTKEDAYPAPEAGSPISFYVPNPVSQDEPECSFPRSIIRLSSGHLDYKIKFDLIFWFLSQVCFRSGA